MRGSRILRLARSSWVDIAWVTFILLNLLAMQLIPVWQTVPFLTIWVTLTAIYGFRLWRLGSALVTVVLVTLATGGLIGWQVFRGEQDADYLAEVPLLAMLFVVMVWHSRRRAAAMDEMRRVSEHNLQLLEQQRRFLQDASHELGTPITIALGHAELIEQAAADDSIATDARAAVAELHRMRRLTSRLLLLAAADGPGSLRLVPVDVEEILVEALRRWNHVPRRWSLGQLDEAWVLGDTDRLTQAVDALIENAVTHTDADGRIEFSLRRDGDQAVVAISDSGPGIAPSEAERIFGRFSRLDVGRSRTTGGFGLGLAIVKAITEAHHGTVGVRSTPGRGSVFEVRLPAVMPAARASEELTHPAVSG
jgi:signal transduction histidine kinase